MQLNGSLKITKALTLVDNIVDVRDHGAIGNGTNDDTIAITNAITALGSTGGTVFFPKGTFKVTSQINISNSSNIVFEGLGDGTTIKSTGATGYVFQFTDCNYIKIKDLRFRGDGIASGNTIGGVNFLISSNTEVPNIEINNVVFFEFKGQAIRLSSPKACTISNVICEDIGGIAIQFVGGFANKIFSTKVLTCNQAGYSLETVKYTSLDDCEAVECGIGFRFVTCESVSAYNCGSQDALNINGTFPGYGFKADGSIVAMIGCYADDSATAHLNVASSGVFDLIDFHDDDTSITTTTLSNLASSSPLIFDTGVSFASYAAQYAIGRNNDGTNRLQLNAPTGATIEWSINDVAELTLTSTALDLQSNNLSGVGSITTGNGLIWSAGTAAVAGNYEIRRNNDGTNRLQSNIPTGATFEWSVNDVAELTLTSTTLDLNSNALSNIGAATFVSTATYSTGAAITAGSYQVQRDADATNQLHFNVPTGTGFEFSVNDVAKILINTNGLLFAGPGAGLATVAYANSATSRTYTIPDAGASANFLMTEGNQTVNGQKNFSAVNSLLIPTGDGSVTNALTAQATGYLQNYNGTSLDRFPQREKDMVQVYNLRLTLGSGTIKLVGHNGSDLSSTNVGILRVPSDTAGLWNELLFTSSPDFNDSTNGTDSDFVGTGTMSWGTTAAVAWATDMPILFGVCTDGSTPIIVMARLPVPTTGASSNIGYKDNAPSAASQNNVIAWTGTNVTTTHANRKITWIGSFRIQKNSSDNWTFSTLDIHDGILDFTNFGIRNFTMPISQNGAASGKYFKDNTGTAPVFTNNNSIYNITMEGKVTFKFRHEADGGTDGATAVNLQLAAPIAVADTGGTDFFRRDVCTLSWNAAANVNYGFMEFSPGTNTIIFLRNATATTRSFMLNSDFPNGGREVGGVIIYDGVRI